MNKTTLDKLIEGMTLIKSVEPDASLCAEHDEVFCGTVEKFNDEQKKKLEELGWNADCFDSFHHYV